MITLIHGEDTAASRNYYYQLKKENPENRTLDGVSVAPIDIQQIAEGSDLFGSTPVIFIEDLFTKRKNAKDLEEVIHVINNSPTNVVLWESKELTAKQVGFLKSASIKSFKIPATIFALLDSLQPRNGKKLIEQFHITLNDKDAEFILVMLQRQVRILISLHQSQGEKISELSRMQPWQLGKLQKQAKLFTPEQLINLHTKLFEIELGMKTGGLSQSLENEIDLLLFSL